ncbi:MAG: DUF3224 domain-containing protein [Bacteroidetes bacterium]|nr:DUF3224 domain-containing protein [Bacteroidota bacterium]
MKATATYSVKKWEESTLQQIPPDMKTTRASVEYELKGDLEGKATVEYLMFYVHADEKDQHNSTAVYTGLIRFEGKLNGRAGSFVMKDDGKFAGGAAESSLKILDGSGTGELKGISGTGMYRADREGARMEVDANANKG